MMGKTHRRFLPPGRGPPAPPPMSIQFSCKCGKALRADEKQAGKQVQCPSCGRGLTVPTPSTADFKVGAAWEIDATARAAIKAAQAGVARRGRASVVLLHAAGPLERDL